MMIFLRLFVQVTLFVALLPGLAPAVGEIKTLAILPFENNSISDPEKYSPLSDGLAAMLITDLNKNKSVLQVIERNKIKALLKEIALSQTGAVDESAAIKAGKILGAQSIGFGAFTIMGEVIRIDMRIIKVESSELVMAESITGETGNFMSLEMELAAKIAEALKAELEDAQEHSQSSIDAALYFAQGLDAMDMGQKKEAETLFGKAIQLDPKYSIQVQQVRE